jgi:hypothetical protein
MSKENTGLNDLDFVSLLAFVQNGKVDEAIAIVKASPNPMEASMAFIELSRHTYRDLRDISSMVALASAGTQFALSKAASCEKSGDEEQLKRYAKVLAFNTAANCWPGWGDVGVKIKNEHLRAGLKLALLCRDLTEQLNLGHKERGTAQWLIGALDLAMGRYAEALAEFHGASEEFQAGGNSDSALLAEGYAALALKAQPQSHSAGADELDRILQRLGLRGSKEAQFFANQLITADRVLISGSLPSVS